MSSQLTSHPSNPDQASEDAPLEVLISGYYGFDNVGDDLILQVLVQQFHRRGLRVSVLSQTPELTAQRYQVEAISRTNPKAIIQAMIRADLFVSGGGGLFQDATGPNSVIYYGGLIALAHLLKVPVVFLGQGVGPLRGAFARWWFAKNIKPCAVITVRDRESAQWIERLTDIEPLVTADPVWLLDLPHTQGKPKLEPGSPWTIALSLRPWHALTPEQLHQLAAFFIRLTEGSEKPIQFALLAFQTAWDTPILEAFQQALTEQNNQLEHPRPFSFQIHGPDTLVMALLNSHVLFGMRFHSLVLGLLMGIPVYGLSYDPKVENLLYDLKLQGTAVGDFQTMDEHKIRHYFARAPIPDLTHLRSQADLNFTALEALIQSLQEKQLLV